MRRAPGANTFRKTPVTVGGVGALDLVVEGSHLLHPVRSRRSAAYQAERVNRASYLGSVMGPPGLLQQRVEVPTRTNAEDPLSPALVAR